MSIKRTLAIAARLTRQLIRDRRACALMVFGPLLIMTLLAFILKTNEQKIRVAITASPDNFFVANTLSTGLSSSEEEAEGFTIETIPDGMEPQNAIKNDLVDAVLIIPDTFIADRSSGKRSSLKLILEGANPMRTVSIFTEFRKVLPESSMDMPKFLPPDCKSHCADLIPGAPPEINIVKVYGEDVTETMDFFTPVLPAFFVFFFVFILSGLSFLRERIGGTAERLLASPLKRSEIVTGYVLGFFAPALIQASIVILFAYYVLGGPWGGWILIVTTVLLLLVADCLGVFISSFARSEFQVLQFIPIIILPQLLLCGIVWPIKGFPIWLKTIAYIFPLTYAVEAIRDVSIRGLGIFDVWYHLVILTVFTILGIVLASLSVRRPTALGGG